MQEEASNLSSTHPRGVGVWAWAAGVMSVDCRLPSDLFSALWQPFCTVNTCIKLKHKHNNNNIFTTHSTKRACVCVRVYLIERNFSVPDIIFILLSRLPRINAAALKFIHKQIQQISMCECVCVSSRHGGQTTWTTASLLSRSQCQTQ